MGKNQLYTQIIYNILIIVFRFKDAYKIIFFWMPISEIVKKKKESNKAKFVLFFV